MDVIRLSLKRQQKSDRGGILDAGCGQGRYLVKLAERFPRLYFYGMDLCGAALASITSGAIEKRKGVLTNIPYPDDMFHLVYSCEAVEHAIDVSAAVQEMIRVTKTGGSVVIIDKPVSKRGAMEIAPWEQWLDDEQMRKIA